LIAWISPQILLVLQKLVKNNKYLLKNKNLHGRGSAFASLWEKEKKGLGFSDEKN